MAALSDHSSGCPPDRTSWDTASAGFTCTPPRVYHCLKTADDKYVEKCLEKTWIQPDMCPEYNGNLQIIDAGRCVGNSTECPDVTYWSNAVYLYPNCLQNSTDDTSADFTVTQQSSNTTSADPTGSTDLDLHALLPFIIGGSILIILIIVLVFICILCRRKRSRHKGRRHEIKIEYTKKQETHWDDLISSDLLNGNNVSDPGSPIDVEKQPFLRSSYRTSVPLGNIHVYVGDDSDKIAETYESLVYENRYDKCQFVKNMTEFKLDVWTKVFFFQDIFTNVETRADIESLREAFDGIYAAATQQPLSKFILEMPMKVWSEHKEYLQEKPLFSERFICIV